MQAAAEAQAKQAAILAETARIQKHQLRQQKESELAQLRHDLSRLKQRMRDGNNSYYVQQQKAQLQSRIYSLKSELYGAPSLMQSIFEIMLDQD